MIRNPSTFVRRGNYVYRIAQEPEPVEEKKEELPPVVPYEHFQDQLFEELPRAFLDIADRAEKMMRKAGIVWSGVFNDGPIPTKDGADISYDISSGELPQARLRFDFTSRWLDSMEEFLTTNYEPTATKLTEVALEYCGHTFVAHGDLWDSLLQSVALFQTKLKQRPRWDLGQLTPNEADIIDYTEGLVQKLIQYRKMNDKPSVDFTDKDELLLQLGLDREPLGITPAVWNTLYPVIKKLDDQKWKNIVERSKAALEAPRQLVPSREYVEAIIQKITSHENYTGKTQLAYDKDGSIIAAIDAPYPLRYRFERVPGGQLNLVEVAMEFCQNTHVGTGDDAKKMITANLDFAEAYETAANPEDEATDPATNIEELVSIFQNLNRQEMIEFLKAQYPEMSEDTIADLLKRISRRGFERKK